MKGDTTLKVLEIIADTAHGFIDVFDAVLSSGYGASYAKLQYEVSKRENAREKMKRERQAWMNYRALLSKLKKDGIIEIRKANEGKIISLTKRGLAKLHALRKRKKDALPEIRSTIEKSNGVLIVAFDIPEKERRKRDWLREALGRFGFRMIQKSVWIGKVKIPKEFLDSLRDLQLIDCVEIFEISKTGTLKHII